MYRATISRLIWLFSLIFLASGCQRQEQLVEQHLLEFGTIIEITMITAELKQAERLLSEIERRLGEYRNQWHAWEDSDLSRFNMALQQNTRAEIPNSLLPLLQLSQSYYEATGGLFNPALGKLIAAHGFHEAEHDLTSIKLIKRKIPDMRDLQIDGNIAISSNPYLQLDLGGIAKGYAVGLVSEFLDSNGVENYIVNAGGDLVTAGDRFGRPWRVGIQNPFSPGVIASIELTGKHSLFTSGNYQRQYWRGTNLAHHIIDPRSGESSTGQSSATVLTTDPVRADVAATALMIDGFRGHRELAASLQIEDFLVVSEKREILLSSSLSKKIEIKTNWPVTIVN